MKTPQGFSSTIFPSHLRTARTLHHSMISPSSSYFVNRTSMRASILVLAILCLTACMEDRLPYEPGRVSTEQNIHVSEAGLRGVQFPEGTVFYVENDLRNLSSYSGPKLNWRVNVSSAMESAMPENASLSQSGGSLIRWLSFDDKALRVICGKHCWATVQITDGVVTLDGCD